MNRQAVAKELLAVAKALTAGTWGLPKNSGDVQKIIRMVESMKQGEPPLPGKPDPADAFYELLGDDDLHDDFETEREHFYKGCANAVVRRIKSLAKDQKDSFRDPAEYDMVVALARKLG